MFIPKSIVNKPLIIQINSYVHSELQMKLSLLLSKNMSVSTRYP